MDIDPRWEERSKRIELKQGNCLSFQSSISKGWKIVEREQIRRKVKGANCPERRLSVAGATTPPWESRYMGMNGVVLGPACSICISNGSFMVSDTALTHH